MPDGPGRGDWYMTQDSPAVILHSSASFAKNMKLKPKTEART